MTPTFAICHLNNNNMDDPSLRFIGILHATDCIIPAALGITELSPEDLVCMKLKGGFDHIYVSNSVEGIIDRYPYMFPNVET